MSVFVSVGPLEGLVTILLTVVLGIRGELARNLKCLTFCQGAGRAEAEASKRRGAQRARRASGRGVIKARQPRESAFGRRGAQGPGRGPVRVRGGAGRGRGRVGGGHPGE